MTVAGEIDSPLYGMFDIATTLGEHNGLNQWYTKQPGNTYEYFKKKSIIEIAYMLRCRNEYHRYKPTENMGDN